MKLVPPVAGATSCLTNMLLSANQEPFTANRYLLYIFFFRQQLTWRYESLLKLAVCWLCYWLVLLVFVLCVIVKAHPGK